jgi:hypothetical protein
VRDRSANTAAPPVSTRQSLFADFRIRPHHLLQLDGQCRAALFPAAAGNG